jgi:biotin-(acetyl-CoA carboxylase) ligase
VRLEHDTLEGRFLDIDDDGALLLGRAEGSRRITAGEIFPARAV